MNPALSAIASAIESRYDSEPRARLGRYVLLHQVGASSGGVRYHARESETQTPVEVCALSDLESEPERSRERSKRLREAALLIHPTARRVLEFAPDHAPPFVALEWLDAPCLAEGMEGSLLAWRQAASAAFELAMGLAEAHRLGLAHGRLGPRTIRGFGPHDLKVDWTGLDEGPRTESTADLPFQAPEQAQGMRVSGAADVYALGVLLVWWLTGKPPAAVPADLPELGPLLRALLAADPDERPSAQRVAELLFVVVGPLTPTVGSIGSEGDLAHTSEMLLGDLLPRLSPHAPPQLTARTHLGRFRLREKLGEGGMGAVYRGEDIVDGTVVALKVLRDVAARRPDALRRFCKEARLLAEVNNPYITNLIELNEDDGVHYLAIEYVEGPNLSLWMNQRGTLDEPIALAIMADVARGLEVAHERGIVHRDIKPENILIVADSKGAPADYSRPPRVKLSDFGLGRHVVETESLNLTQPGAQLGTPLYMSPEQCAGSDQIGPPADVYAMGATLFHILAGRPPFVGSSALNLFVKHQSEPPPDLKTLNPAVSDGAAQVVAKALAKPPAARYAHAGAMLLDFERLLRGEPTGIDVHPRLPHCDPKDLVRFDFQWELDASPRQLWPLVSNTERVNRAIGLPAVPFVTEFDPEEGVQRFGQLRTAGMLVNWREHPYEWIEGRRMGVLRVFQSGPFRWFVSVVELHPRAGGGTLLTHGIRIAVNGLLGRTVANVKIGHDARRAMDQVYRRIDAALTGKLGQGAALDPFEPPPPLSKERRQRLDQWLHSLIARGIDSLVAERVVEFVAEASPQEVARIRPLALARRLGLPPAAVVATCLQGARDGILVLLWDILCPICRIPSEAIDTLRALREHGRCEACHSDFTLDFANSVELIFRAHPEVRETELGTYCIGGPAHSPHVAAQLRVSPGERVVLELALTEGTYRLRGPQLAFALDFRVERHALHRRLDLSLTRGPGAELPRTLRAGSQALALSNDGAGELVVRVERTAPREDALTAARASALALFRELFPNEVLAAGQLINLATVTLVVTELAHAGDLYEELGDARAFAIVHEHFRRIDDGLRRHGGALIKTVNTGTVGVFPDARSAVAAALDLARHAAATETSHPLGLRVGVHRGSALVATLNDHLDYFGMTVNIAARLPELAGSGEVILSQAVAADPRVAALFQGRQLSPEIVPARLPGLPEGFVQRISAAGAQEPSADEHR